MDFQCGSDGGCITAWRAELMVLLRTVLRTIRTKTIFLVCEKLVEEPSSQRQFERYALTLDQLWRREVIWVHM